MGVILANFRSSGNYPFAILLFIKEAIGLYIIGAESLSNLGPIKSIPAAFDVSSLCNITKTLFSSMSSILKISLDGSFDFI